MSTLKDQLAKLGISVDDEPFSPAWGGAHRDAKPRPSQREGGERREGAEGRGRGEGRKGAPQGARQGRDQGREQRRGQGRERRERQPRFEVPSDPEARQEAARALIKRERLPLPPAGPRRVYVQVEDQIDFINIDPQSHERFQSGELGLVVDERGRLCVLPRRALEELSALRS